MTSTRRFPWLWASFFLLLSIGGLIAYDVSRVGGNFPKSATGRLLNDLGVLEQTQNAWQKALSTSARGYIWLETNTPVYYTQAVDVSKPYLELGRDLIIVGSKNACSLYGNLREYVVAKAPVVHATIDEYAPGLVNNVVDYASKGWETASQYGGNCYNYTSEVLREKVFVGQLSPQNIQDKTQSALNVTRHHVSSYLHWVRQQIHIYSEIP